MMNDLHINLKKVESARNDVEYWLYVIRAIYLICPKGYIELQALCSELYGDKAGKYLSRLQLVGVKVKEPVLMKWTEEGASVLKNRILVPLAFVAGCYEKLIAADYEKAYALFLVSQSCHEL
jgi:hypothetical protein